MRSLSFSSLLLATNPSVFVCTAFGPSLPVFDIPAPSVYLIWVVLSLSWHSLFFSSSAFFVFSFYPWSVFSNKYSTIFLFIGSFLCLSLYCLAIILHPESNFNRSSSPAPTIFIHPFRFFNFIYCISCVYCL